MSSGLLSDPAIDADIVVIDNGRTLEPKGVVGATLIPNNNLGGSGGFAYGSCHLQGVGKYTHAVFMDDDASTELASEKRAVRLLRYIHNDATAIASGLIFEEYAGIQLEAAGQMREHCWTPARLGEERCSRSVAWSCKEFEIREPVLL